MAHSLKTYSTGNLSRTSTNSQVLDLIELCDQLCSSFETLASLRATLNREINADVIPKMDDLILASKPPEEINLNDNQLELETEHVINLRNAGLSKVSHTFYTS